MFDIGFSELLLFGVIALVVLGPEKLPHAARTAGQWYAKIRRTMTTLQHEIEAELDLAETRQKMQEELKIIKQTEADMKREMAELRGSMQEFEKAQNQSLTSNTSQAVNDSQASDNSQASREVSDSSQHSKPHSNTDAHTTDAYAYGAHNTHDDNPVAYTESKCTESKHSKQALNEENQATFPLLTRPWAHMWFLLGSYDKARRLPPPPLMPNYQVDVLLNAPVTMTTSDNSASNDNTFTDNVSTNKASTKTVINNNAPNHQNILNKNQSNKVEL